MAVLKFKSVLVLIGMTIIAGESSTINQIFLEMIKYYIYFLPGEASGSQERMKRFEKMDAKTWQTLAEFIVSKYRENFCKALEKMDEKICISRLLEISDLKYKEIFAAIDKDGNGGISRSGQILIF